MNIQIQITKNNGNIDHIHNGNKKNLGNSKENPRKKKRRLAIIVADCMSKDCVKHGSVT